MEGALERQRRFPLDTANALRGRLRRENFHIFKRGSKGITYACSVRRKFRLPGQAFADSVQKLLSHLEANPMTPVATLPEAFLGIPIHGAHEGDGEGIEHLPNEEKETLKRMAMDLRWLVSEGYVAEYSDGRLFAAPPAQEPAPKKEKKKRLWVEKAKDPGESKSPEEASTPMTVAGTASGKSKSPDEDKPEGKVVEPVSSDAVEPPDEPERKPVPDSGTTVKDADSIESGVLPVEPKTEEQSATTPENKRQTEKQDLVSTTEALKAERQASPAMSSDAGSEGEEREKRSE